MSWMRLLAVSRSVRPIAYPPSRYKLVTEGLPRLRARPAERRATEVTTMSARVSTPEDSGGAVSSTSQRKVAQAPAKAGWAIGMFRFFKKLFVSPTSRIQAVVRRRLGVLFLCKRASGSSLWLESASTRLTGSKQIADAGQGLQSNPRRPVRKDPKMTVLEAGPCAAPRQTFDVPPQAYPRGRWTVFKNPFVKRGKPVEAAAPVQGELLLDLVKPIRNDLSDSDLEVVPAIQGSVVTKTAADAEPQTAGLSPAVPVTGDLEPARADWARMRDQFFGLEKL